MKRIALICALCLIVSIAVMVWGFRDQPEETLTTQPVYALLLFEDRGTAVMQLKQGAQTAADRLSVLLKTYTVGEEAQDRPSLLGQADAEKQLAGLLLPRCSEEVASIAATYAQERDIPLVYLGGASDAMTVCVLTDWEEQGRLLGEAYLSQARGDARVYAFYEEGDAEQVMLRGLRVALPGQEVHTGTDISALTDTDAAFILTPVLVEPLAAQAVGRLSLWAVDPGDARVALLEKGLVRGLVMEMPYAQGVLAVQAAHGSEGYSSGGRPVYSQSRVVTPDTMYDTENIKLMFPLLQ